MLTWKGHPDYEGLEVVCRASTSIEKVLGIQAAIAHLVDNGNAFEEILAVLQRFGEDFLVNWNLADENGVDYPPTGESLCSLPDPSLQVDIILKWVEAVTSVKGVADGPLDGKSIDGDRSLEQSLPMESV